MKLELTGVQGRIMGYLGVCETPPCARDIEEKFKLSHPTVSGLLSRLERKNFIEFRPDAQDKRRKRVYILPKGVDCNEQIYRVIQSNEQQIVKGFSQEEKAQFTDFLTRAARNLGLDSEFHLDKEELEE